MNPAFELREAVELVTTAGRETFLSSWGLMQALDRCDGETLCVEQIREGGRGATARSIAALNCYFRGLGPGLRNLRRNPERVGTWFTRYGWAELKDLLSLEFEAKNIVVARLTGSFFGAPAHPALLVAAWDGSFENLRAATP
jgi:hypothetical protein